MFESSSPTDDCSTVCVCVRASVCNHYFSNLLRRRHRVIWCVCVCVLSHGYPLPTDQTFGRNYSRTTRSLHTCSHADPRRTSIKITTITTPPGCVLVCVCVSVCKFFVCMCAIQFAYAFQYTHTHSHTLPYVCLDVLICDSSERG